MQASPPTGDSRWKLSPRRERCMLQGHGSGRSLSPLGLQRFNLALHRIIADPRPHDAGECFSRGLAVHHHRQQIGPPPSIMLFQTVNLPRLASLLRRPLAERGLEGQSVVGSCWIRVPECSSLYTIHIDIALHTDIRRGRETKRFRPDFRVAWLKQTLFPDTRMGLPISPTGLDSECSRHAALMELFTAPCVSPDTCKLYDIGGVRHVMGMLLSCRGPPVGNRMIRRSIELVGLWSRLTVALTADSAKLGS